MKSLRVDHPAVISQLREKCPFIIFALLGTPDAGGFPGQPEIVELSVFLDEGRGPWGALEEILSVIAGAVPGAGCDVILLNQADPETRDRVLQGHLLFVKEGKEQVFEDFRQRSGLDCRILRARIRRNGAVARD